MGTHTSGPKSFAATTPPRPPAMPRRNVIRRLWRWGIGLVMATAGLPYLQLLRSLSGTVEDIRISGQDMEQVRRGKPVILPSLFLLPRAGGGVLALSRRCTHLGCKVRLDRQSQTLRCPCHGSVFDYRGDVVRGPASRALTRVRLRRNRGTWQAQVADPDE